MANQLYSNNATSILAADCLIGELTAQVQPGEGALFPSPAPGQFFTAALQDINDNIEIVTCTDVTGDILTIVRAQENTIEQNFLLGDTRIECRPTAAVMAAFVQSDDAIFTGDVSLGGNALINGEIVAVPLRGATGDTSNQLVVPPAGARPTIGGVGILLETDTIIPPGLIGMWSGLIGNIPTGWALCNGGNGTPDLSGQFIVSYDAGNPLFDTVGNQGGSALTSIDGAHDHSGATDPRTLLESDIPTLTITAHSAISNNSSDNHNIVNRVAAGAQNNDNPSVSAVEYVNGAPTSHTHGIPSDGDHVHDFIPPYYVLAFIMKL